MTKEGEIVTYEQLAGIEDGNDGEPLVPVEAYDASIIAEYEKQDMLQFTGPAIYVREFVAKMLASASKRLATRGMRFRVVYGYRHPDIQRAYYETRRAELRASNPDASDVAITELTHAFVAVPSVAGHPTGGAVDLTLTDTIGKPLDTGTGIADYGDPSKIRTFAAGLSPVQSANRKLLHDTLRDTGFAPFYGEWWHFSYGDREWAFFYDKSRSLYAPVAFRI